ncbi:unnamed protein product [Effrenium voratum]|nr:unnamed protein product [Effrenium voratum]
MLCHACCPAHDELPEQVSAFEGAGAEEATDASYPALVTGDVTSFIASLDVSDPHCIIVKDLRFFAAWNADLRHEQVEVFDQVLQMNEEACSSTSLRASLGRGAIPMRLILRKPDERLVAIDRERDLGLDINFRRKVSIKPWIASVREGPLEQWNQAKPNLRVMPHDRILAINGVAGEPAELVQKLWDPKLSNLFLTVLHYNVSQL